MMKNIRYLIASAVLILCLAACTSTRDYLKDLSPNDAASMSDKKACEFIFWYENKVSIPYNNEVDRRGLSLNQCCFKRLMSTPAYCRGYVVGNNGIMESSPANEPVALILSKKETKGPYQVIGELYDTWDEKVETGVVLDSDMEQLILTQFLSSASDARPLSLNFVKARFESLYSERAREVGADGLILTLAERRKYEAPIVIGTTGSATRKAEKFRINFEVIKYINE